MPKLVRFFLRGRIAVLVAIGLAAAAAVAALSPVKGGLVTPAAVLAAESKAVPAGPQIQADAPTLISMRTIIAQSRGPRALRVEPKAPAITNRPTMDIEKYKALKERAGKDAASAALGPIDRVLSRQNYVGRVSPFGAAPPPDAAAPTPAAPTGVLGSFDGVSDLEACGPFCRPPDADMAVGNAHIATVTNSNLNIYTKLPFVQIASVRLNAFFGYDAEFAFDPRVLYDEDWDRWIVYVEAFPQENGAQLILFAVSTTSNPTGSYYRYYVNVNIFNNDDFWDFGQMGMDQDSLIFTANVFGPTDFRGARTFAVAKARTYNGLGWGVPLFIGLEGTLAPPRVRDQNASTYLVAAPPEGNVVWKYTMRDSSRPNATRLTLDAIPVPFYTVPANASQPGTANVLDTLDARFQNRSTQVGNSIFQVHTVALGPFPTPLWYEFDGTSNTIVQAGYFYRSLTSHDFNPHIAANSFFDVFVEWSATEPGAFRGAKGQPAEVLVAGRRSTDAAGTLGPAVSLFVSPTSYELFRWGDYSAVAYDPVAPLQAWTFNEKINNPFAWGTNIGHVTH